MKTSWLIGIGVLALFALGRKDEKKTVNPGAGSPGAPSSSGPITRNPGTASNPRDSSDSRGIPDNGVEIGDYIDWARQGIGAVRDVVDIFGGWGSNDDSLFDSNSFDYGYEVDSFYDGVDYGTYA